MQSTEHKNSELPLELDSQSRLKLIESVNYYTETFLSDLPNKKAYVENLYDRTALDEQFEIDGTAKPIEQLVSLKESRIDDTGLNPASGGHLG